MQLVIKIEKKCFFASVLVAVAFSERLENAISWLYPFIVLSIFVGYVFTIFLNKHRFNFNTPKMQNVALCMKYGLIPYLIIMIYSILIITKNHLPSVFMMRNLGSSFSNIFIILVVASITYLFEKSAVDVVCDGLIINYIVQVIAGVGKIGFSGILQHILDPLNAHKSIFEIHHIGLALCLFLIYYVMHDFKHNKVKILILLIIEYLIMKRIVFVGLALAIVFFIILNVLLKEVSNLKYKICFILLFVGVWAYLIISSNPIFQVIMQDAGIYNRYLLVNSLKEYYEYSPYFFGRGYGFVSVIIPSQNIAGVTGIAALHNDILKDYIELGFWGFSMAYFYFFTWLPIKIFGNKKKKTTSTVLFLLVYMLVTLMTDNTFEYISFLGSLFTILVVLNFSEQSEKVRL